ncbi:hypothetical protein KIN20_014632, partial [Parelaphostrongylus tenuis]
IAHQSALAKPADLRICKISDPEAPSIKEPQTWSSSASHEYVPPLLPLTCVHYADFYESFMFRIYEGSRTLLHANKL